VLDQIDIQANEVNSRKRRTREEAAKLTEELFPGERYERKRPVSTAFHNECAPVMLEE
jgi:hypothetical protein